WQDHVRSNHAIEGQHSDFVHVPLPELGGKLLQRLHRLTKVRRLYSILLQERFYLGQSREGLVDDSVAALFVSAQHDQVAFALVHTEQTPHRASGRIMLRSNTLVHDPGKRVNHVYGRIPPARRNPPIQDHVSIENTPYL